MTPATHQSIDAAWVGAPILMEEGHAVARLTTLPAMAADPFGLVHGGFVFGLADYAAMLAVNDPNVVLGAAETRFVAPVAVGEVVEAEATREETRGRKQIVRVICRVGEKAVMEGTFTTFVLDKHVLAG